LLLPILLVSLSACGDESIAATVFEIEMTSSYDDSDPFINEKLFYVSEDTESVDFEAHLQMKSETCLLEIADNETKEVLIEVFLKERFNDSGEDKEHITLFDLDKDKEYIIRLTCTKVENVKLVMTTDSSLVKERKGH
jgi:hypothetical protein